MKTNRYIKIIAATSLLLLSQQTLATAFLNTTSSYYELQGGATFNDGEMRSQTSSGGLFWAMGENGDFDFTGEGKQYDQYGNSYGGYGWMEISRTENSLRQFGGQEHNWSSNSSVGHQTNFIDSLIEWEFDVLYDDAWVDYLLLFSGTGSIDFNITNMTTGKSLFNVDNYSSILSGPIDIILLQDNHYRLSSTINNSSPSDGMYSETDIHFANAEMQLPTPKSALLFLLAILFFSYSRKKID
ncbi:MAG: hypothetical protein ACJAT7_001713 [Psychromonas sp.]|jgi:hypothetical protein|uniref:hypothetical protein n=1 Tax=Psychromonas sp. TaxID=1884585 RepID=UPI0039E4A307